jgi:hypothetical protein
MSSACHQNKLAYFALAISYKYKIFMKWVPVVDIINNLQPQLTAATTSCSLNKFMHVITTATYLITTVSHTHIFYNFVSLVFISLQM